MRKNIMNVGVIGAGAISDTYLENMLHLFDGLNVRSVCAGHLENARKKAEKYGIRACTAKEMMSDPEIGMVVVLTPVGSHYSLIKDALEAGKHVYTEKTITETTDQAAQLLRLTDESGLYLGCAPDTFLGTAHQTARRAVDDGLIGEVNSFSIAINRNNDLLTLLFPFLRMPGAGALRDYLVYYLTGLIALLGPVAELGAFVRAPYPKRVGMIPGMADYGKEIDTPNESIVSAILRLESGVTGTIHEDNETVMEDRADFVIYGTKGILLLGNSNDFGNPVRLLQSDEQGKVVTRILEPVGEYSGNVRGLGAAEMAEAIFVGRKNRACKELAYHVLDVVEGMEESSRAGTMIRVSSRCKRPEPFAQKL